jgi:hypothetical protein
MARPVGPSAGLAPDPDLALAQVRELLVVIQPPW